MIREIDFSGRIPDIIKLDKILPRTRGIILFYVNNKLKGQIIFNDKIRITNNPYTNPYTNYF